MLHTPPFSGQDAVGRIVRVDDAHWHNGPDTLRYAEVLVDPAANDGHMVNSNLAVRPSLREPATAV